MDGKESALIILLTGISFATVHASFLDTIGVTLLRAATTNLDGTGVAVGQAEGDDPGTPPGTNTWEVRPNAVGQPTNLFTYFYSAPPLFVTVKTANTFTNSLGLESGHAEFVAGNFYGITNGVATNVDHVDNYEADTFYNYFVNKGHAISERIVNQSFTFGTNDASIDQIYDNYAAQNNVLFVSGAGFNGQPVYTPATCYNGIGVGSEAFNSPNGPTSDGRSKPDIIGFGPPETSYTAPEVAGAAAVLMQAGTRGDGGSDTNSATDMRTVKALLLNGAVKPAGWTNSPSAPLHPRYGAGVLNVFNAYEQLAGGKHVWNFSTNVPQGTVHPPVAVAGVVPVLSGWDFNSISSTSGGLLSSAADGVNHYFFNATNGNSGATFAATATLVWNRQQNQSAINNLDLFLFNADTSNLVACSTSLVDNVEQVFVPRLPQGRYDLQVWKAGGSGIVSSAETYALAWAFVSPSLEAARSGTNFTLSWPVYPDGFHVEAAANLAASNWSSNSIPAAVFTNGRNVVVVGATNSAQFFRLRTP
jgi:Subtilase family